MNPDYAGRSELPDNLKSLLRPVAMVVADIRFIAEISLFSEGFQEGTRLGQKMVSCFKMAAEQLSHQTHYHFGMRYLKSWMNEGRESERGEMRGGEEERSEERGEEKSEGGGM